MDDNKAIASFASGSVPKAVLRNALPAIAAMIMVLVYNLADTFFIGQTHNDYMVAAVSLATPVFLIFMSLGTLFGMGGTSVISRALGEGRFEYAKKVSAFCMWACVAVGALCMLFLWAFMDQILAWLGASADTAGYTRTYLNIVAACGIFSLLSNCYSNILRAEGKSTAAMGGTLIGNLLNVILDPIMILAFNWGIAGAAIATVIGNVVGALYYLIYFWRGRSSLSISLKDFSAQDRICSGVLSIGIPASLGSLLMSISQMITNSRMAQYGDMAVAGYGVAAKVLMIVTLIGIGIGQGIQALLGYCYGAKNHRRFQSSLRFSLVFGLVLCSLTALICYAFTGPIVKAFLSDPEALEYGIRFSRIMLTTAWLFGAYYVLMNAMQALGAATPSLMVSVCRQGFIYIPAVYILGAALGMSGLVWAQPLADVLSLLITVILFASAMRRAKWDPVDEITG
ncbi:MAG: MATE family efflux transporter [Oscillospiraceae bacterium]|nr:MATE family efflux transporter [Oscillospiraceae bacterium]